MVLTTEKGMEGVWRRAIYIEEQGTESAAGAGGWKTGVPAAVATTARLVGGLRAYRVF